MAKKIAASELKQAHATFMKAVGGTFTAMEQGGVFGRFKREGIIGRRLSQRYYERYLSAGGEAGNWQEFAKWLLENLPAIIAAIMALFA
jgi:hypothetical protein